MPPSFFDLRNLDAGVEASRLSCGCAINIGTFHRADWRCSSAWHQGDGPDRIKKATPGSPY